MKGELVLIDSEFLKDDMNLKYSAYGFGLEIYVDEENPLEKQIKRKDIFDESMKITKELRDTDNNSNDEEDKIIDYLDKNFDNIMDSVEYIVLQFDDTDVKEYINKNLLSINKKIVLPDVLDITDYDMVVELMNEYSNIIERVYITLQGNSNYVSLVDCYRTMKKIQEYADNIKKLKLSKMETIMYVYDIVRNRVYVEESELENSGVSRDISKVLFGDKIVCLGYANIFYTLLYYLGIESKLVSLGAKDPTQAGHARNVIYIKDDKYNIDGVYYFDATWDSKRIEGDNSYLYRYKFFAKTREYMDNHNYYNLEDRVLDKYSPDMCKKITTLFRKEKYEELIQYVKSTGNMIRLTKNEDKMPLLNPATLYCGYIDFEPKDFLKGFRKVFKLFNKEIPAESMIKLLNNVRKVEYYNDSNWCPYTVVDLYKIFVNSGWKFENSHLDERARLIKAIEDEEFTKAQEDAYNFKGYAQENDMYKKVGQVKVAKVLKLVLEKKKSEEQK